MSFDHLTYSTYLGNRPKTGKMTVLDRKNASSAYPSPRVDKWCGSHERPIVVVDWPIRNHKKLVDLVWWRFLPPLGRRE